jgi:hypothetical protein
LLAMSSWCLPFCGCEIMDAEAAAPEARLRIRFFSEQRGSVGSSSHCPRRGGKERAVGDNSVGDSSVVATLRCILEA